MRRLTSIVAVNPQGVIGCGNALPWRVRSDLQFFKERTMGNIVIMGRKTFESIGKPLPGRYNIILTHQFSLFAETETCRIATSIGEALFIAEQAPKKTYKEAFVVGGAYTYEQFSDLVDRYLITVVNKEVPDGDAFFDEGIVHLDQEWRLNEISDGLTQNVGDEVPFRIFELNAKRAKIRKDHRSALLSHEKRKRLTSKDLFLLRSVPEEHSISVPV